jgi:hypothetical protein
VGNYNSGRHKLPETIIRECNALFDGKATELYQVLMSKALSGSLEALIYIFDRRFGRPSQELKATIKSTFEFGADDLALMRRVTVTELPIIDGIVRELPEASDQIESMDNEITPGEGDNND